MKTRGIIFAIVALLACTQAFAAKVDPALKRNAALKKAFTELNASARKSVVTVERARSGRRRGLGAVLSKQGEVITALGIISSRNTYQVRLWNGKTRSVEVIARDYRNDLALLKMKDPPEDLEAVEAGNGNNVETGQFVISPSPDKAPVAVGVKSCPLRRIAKARIVPFLGLFSVLTDDNKGPQRPYPTALQHDSPITATDIGGPLVDADGGCVGVNVCAAWRGVSLAVPWEAVEKVLPNLRKGVDVKANGFIGVEIEVASEDLLGENNIEGGVLVKKTVDGPAEAGGMEAGDVITHINGESIRTPDDLREIVRYITPGEKAVFRVTRKTKGEETVTTVDLKIKVTARPGS